MINLPVGKPHVIIVCIEVTVCVHGGTSAMKCLGDSNVYV